MTRIPDSRALTITTAGRKKLSELGLEESPVGPASRVSLSHRAGLQFQRHEASQQDREIELSGQRLQHRDRAREGCTGMMSP